MADGSGGAEPGVSSGEVGRWLVALLKWAWLAPAVLGAALGAVGWLVSGWPWWPLVGAVSLWWAAFLLLLCWPGLRPGRFSLWTELLLLVYPSKGLARMHGEEELRFRRAAFPVYGLPASHAAQRFLGGSGTGGSWRHGRAVRWLSLRHGDPLQPGDAWLIVESAPVRSAPAPTAQRRRLAERLWVATQMEEWRTHGRFPRNRVPVARRPDPAWSPVRIAVDGVPVVFDYLADGESWAARAAHGDVVVSVLASRMPAESVTLAAVTDLEAYISGSRRLRTGAACPVPPPHPAA